MAFTQISISNIQDNTVVEYDTYTDFADGVSNSSSGAFNKANSANILAQSAFTAANIADQRAVTSGVYANAAFAAANTGSADSYARLTANAASSYANGAFTAANTADQRAVTSGSYANSAYAAANTADQKAVTSGLYANSAYAAANTADQQSVISGSYANSAFTTANTPSHVANSASSYANGAFARANSTITTTGGTITGSLNVTQDLTVTGNLYILGNTTTINTSSFGVSDSLLTLAVGNYTNDLLDIGISAHYNDGTNAHVGFIRDHGTKEWYLFKGYIPELTPNNNININDASFSKANINADYFKGNVVFSDGSIQTTAATQIDQYARNNSNSAFTAANTADQRAVTSGSYANAAFAEANTADQQSVTSGSYANSAYAAANTADQRAVTSGSYANAAFAAANTADQQSVTSGSYANSAYAAANTADQRAVTSGSYANAAFAEANNKFNSSGGTFTGPITGNVSIATNSSAANSIGYLGVPQSNLNPMSTNYTLVIGDVGEHLYMVPSSNSLNVLIPSNASVPFPIGTSIITVLDAAYTSNVVPTTGVTLRMAGNTLGANIARTIGYYSVASLLKVGSDSWYISGSGVT